MDKGPPAVQAVTRSPVHSADVITTASAWSSAAENEGPLTGSPVSSRQHREAAGPACRGGFTLTPDLEADYCGGQRGTRATRGVPFFGPDYTGVRDDDW